MDASDSPLAAGGWPEHARALRRLAAGLVRDPHDAEDLVQETWLRARRAEAPSGSWLRTVLRNLVRDRARERSRRASTEAAAARPDGLPSSAEIVARMEVAQRVAREAARLEEPYRLVIHLRYFEDRPVEAIAADLGLPPETVRTRLRRGLVLLRERMDRAHGDERGAWMGALLSFVDAPRTAPIVEPVTSSTLAAGAKTLVILMQSKLALSVGAAALVVVGIQLWNRSGPSPRVPLGGPDPQESRAMLRALPSVPAAREPVESEAAASPATGAPAAPRAEPRSIEVRVLVVDEKGGEHASEGGTLLVATGHSQADAQVRELSFADGHLEVPVAEGEWIVFGQLVAGGRPAVLPDPVPVVPGDEPLVVRGEWLAHGRLRVIDADSRQDLSGIELRCADGWRANPDFTHPGDDPRIATVVEQATSPVDLPESLWLTPYWVHAPGHAWARVDFDHKVGGQRTVELDARRGSVAASLLGTVPAGAWIRLYEIPDGPQQPDENGIVWMRPPPEEAESWMASISVRAREGETRIEDFRPGRYLASVETGEYESRLKLGSAEVEVLDGVESRVMIPCDVALLDVPRTHLFGSIRVPEDLERGDCTLNLERVGGGEPVFTESLATMGFTGSDRMRLLWDAGPRRTGVYTASISGIQHRVLFEAWNEGGDSELRIEVPALVTVEVEVVDATTGAALEPERLQWADGAVEGIDGNTLQPIVRDPSTGRFLFRAPRGPVSVRATADGYREGQEELELVPPEVHVRLELERAQGIRLAIREGGATLPVGMEFLFGVRVLGADGAPAAAHWSLSDSEASFFVDRPGSYTLVLPELEGFAPMEPRTVLVEPEHLVDVVVEAERLP